jgi:hypothetical protein
MVDRIKELEAENAELKKVKYYNECGVCGEVIEGLKDYINKNIALKSRISKLEEALELIADGCAEHKKDPDKRIGDGGRFCCECSFVIHAIPSCPCDIAKLALKDNNESM